jgi:branched-chain amino acid transport system ATP-binding protein
VSALELSDVYADYSGYKALNGLSVRVEPGEAVAILGRNGVGKSTLARVATALVPFSSGRVAVLGRDLGKLSTHSIARLGVVHLPEGVGLFSALSIEENLIMRVGGSSRSEQNQRLDHALATLGKLKERRRAKAGQLSGGQQRLVAVAAAIAAQPKLLLADEPALGLSPAAAEDVYEALAGVKATSAAVVIIETRLGRVEQLCERAVVLDSGRCVFDGLIKDAHDVLVNLL